MKTSPAARDLIKRFEPFRAEAVQSEDGRWVVGYGHRAAAKAGVTVTEDEAALLLIYDVMRAEEVVDDSITGPLSRGQRDALTSFVHDVGVDRFRGSDVARYLFEGRARAAGEALAIHGDDASARREAESTLFLDALMPAKPGQSRKSEPVELVIKIEHPSEERVLEGAIGGGDTPPPDAFSDLPPPPPPPDAGLARRREAEDEIARILAAVEALPPDVRQDLTEPSMEPVAEAVSDMRDDPIEAEYQAVEPDVSEVDAECDTALADAPATADEMADTVPVEDEAATEPDVAAVDAPQAQLDPETAADRVIARMDEEIGEAATAQAENVADADSEAPAAEVTPNVPTREPEVAPEVEPERPVAAAPIAAFDLPEGTGLGFVLANRQPVADPEANASIAETEPEVAPESEPQSAAALPEHYAMALPQGMGLGYALTSVMEGRFLTEDEAEVAPEAEPEAQPQAEPDAEPESAEVVDDLTAPDIDVDAEPVVEPAAAGDSGSESELRPADEADIPAEIIERAVSLSGDDTPPPHPADMPAEAAGAVGEVEGEPGSPSDAIEPGADALAAEDPLMDGADPMSDADDDFSPRDLAADVHATDDRPGPSSDDGMWTFLAVLVAGLLLAGFGSVLAAAEWDYIMAQREMTLNFGMALAGFFLVIVAGWQLASIWLSKLKQKAGN
ncbi:glycoside hydrolase family protein [Maricaulis maris]|uniref:glycoside hydrolase family protein n=1 Tax=Maricaulis maris TaxID=74318 RepID=UPI003BAC422F